MDLMEYRREYGVSFAWIARQCGVSPQAIHAIARGARPGWELAGGIERATKGLVKRASWYPPDADVTPNVTTSRDATASQAHHTVTGTVTA